jgi:hypothetical protein
MLLDYMRCCNKYTGYTYRASSHVPKKSFFQISATGLYIFRTTPTVGITVCY